VKHPRLKLGAGILLAVLCLASVVAYLILSREPDPYVGIKPVRNLVHLEKRLKKAVDASAKLTLEVLGEVRYGDFSAPLWVISYSPVEEARGRVFLSGGVHGNEPAGTESVVRFIELLADAPEAYEDIAFDLVPLVNPWGWVHTRRKNQEGRDINRDFNSFKTQEGALLRTFLEGKEYDLVIDEHEDSDCDGFYLYELATGHSELCREIIERERARGYPIEQDTWMVIYRTKDGLISSRMWSLYAALYTRMTSLSIYCRINNSDQVYLIETPRRMRLAERLDMHQSAREMMIEGVVASVGRGNGN